MNGKRFTIALLIAATVAGGMCAILLRPSPRLQPLTPEKIAMMIREDSRVRRWVPPGTTFANAQRILGNDFQTSPTNSEGAYFAAIHCTLPGQTNRSRIDFLVRSNVVVWLGHLSQTNLPEPPVRKSP